MRKLSILITLMFALTVTGFAEGDIHTGGRTCPTGQTCLYDPQEPSDTPIPQNDDSLTEDSETSENSSGLLINQIYVFLNSIF